MVDFGSDYWNPLDKKPIETLKVSIKDLGTSTGAGDLLQGFKSDLSAGATHVELGFTGMAKGSLGQGNTTPEMFGKDKREAIRELSKINEVGITTHASIGINNLSGLDTKNGRFSDTAARETLNEIKRTIDFSAEAAGGGAVVVHTGEFPRDIGEYKEFGSEDVKKEEIVILVDKKTGEIARPTMNKGEEIYIPELVVNQNGDWIDVNGNPTTDRIKAIPQVDENAQIIFTTKNWDDYKKEAPRLRKEDPKKFGNLTDDEVAAKQMFIEKQWAELERSKPFAHQYYRAYKQGTEQIKDLQKLQKRYEWAEKGGDIETIKQDFIGEAARSLKENYNPHLDGKPSEFINKKIKEAQNYAQVELEGYRGYSRQIEQIKLLNERIEPISVEGKKRSIQNITKAATYAIRKEEQMERQGQKIDPIYIAPENIFPESGYGSHPDELKYLIVESRKELAKQLQNEGKSKEQATKIAEDHIKATFDIGHANVWRRFFKEDENKLPEENNKDFNKWLLKKVDELNKEKIIGHAHISDNFGYHDEHLTPGMGSAPIAEFIEKMKKAGMTEPMIVEWGAQSKEGEPYGAMLGAWARLASSPMYRIDGLQQSWTDIEHSGYFGRASSPNFIIGKYGPSKDWNAWGWSEASIE